MGLLIRWDFLRIQQESTFHREKKQVITGSRQSKCIILTAAAAFNLFSTSRFLCVPSEVLHLSHPAVKVLKDLVVILL